ncbi:tescalcin b isoform X1 [Stigmatopora argus]
MGIWQSISGPPEYRQLAEKTGFNCEQIRVLHKRFMQLSHNEDSLRREHFNAIHDLTWNPIRTQIVEAFFDRRNLIPPGEGSMEEIHLEEFVVVMSHFKPPSLSMTDEEREGVRKEKLRCAPCAGKNIFFYISQHIFASVCLQFYSTCMTRTMMEPSPWRSTDMWWKSSSLAVGKWARKGLKASRTPPCWRWRASLWVTWSPTSSTRASLSSTFLSCWPPLKLKPR